ncbi:MAG: hypothetical protein HY306_11770 [Nitrosomonadales bacterium]|nr:hypothetical protein [Nitrosomonadales bacterium]
MSTPRQVRESRFARLRRVLRTFSSELDKTQLAIVLSEAGDVEGAQALLDKPRSVRDNA